MFLFLFPAIASKMSTLQFEDLPNELILDVLGYLNIKELIYCGQLSKRIREISNDETLWQAMNLYLEPWKDCSRNKVPAEFLHMVISNGCKYLSLNREQIAGVGPKQGGLKLNEESSLIYLKLVTIIQASIIPDPNPDPNLPKNFLGGDVHFSDRLSEELLQKCQSLQKLSLSGYVSPDMAFWLSEWENIESVRPPMVYFQNQRNSKISGKGSRERIEFHTTHCKKLSKFERSLFSWNGWR